MEGFVFQPLREFGIDALPQRYYCLLRRTYVACCYDVSLGTSGRFEVSALCRVLYTIPSGGICCATKPLEDVGSFPLLKGFALLYPVYFVGHSC